MGVLTFILYRFIVWKNLSVSRSHDGRIQAVHIETATRADYLSCETRIDGCEAAFVTAAVSKVCVIVRFWKPIPETEFAAYYLLVILESIGTCGNSLHILLEHDFKSHCRNLNVMRYVSLFVIRQLVTHIPELHVVHFQLFYRQAERLGNGGDWKRYDLQTVKKLNSPVLVKPYLYGIELRHIGNKRGEPMNAAFGLHGYPLPTVCHDMMQYELSIEFQVVKVNPRT